MNGPRLFVVASAWMLAFAVVPGCFEKKTDVGDNFVDDEPYSKIHVEVDYAEGRKADAGAVNLLRERITERLSKPGGQTLEEKSFQPDRSVYDTDDLLALEDRLRNRDTGGDTIVLYVLYLNGHHADDTDDGKILGVKYAATSIAIFKETVDNSGGILGINFNADQVERAVLVHEFGHAIGLVNLGLTMTSDHEDEEHKGHSDNENSVMYWAVENTFGLPGLDTIPDDFDEMDIADIRAAGGK